MPKAKAADHDPGPLAAGERGEAEATAARHPIQVEKATVRIGTASWTDPTMVEPGVFYPPDATNAEDADELGEWIPRIRQAASNVTNLHLLMNNCYANYGTTNAREIAALLEGPQ